MTTVDTALSGNSIHLGSAGGMPFCHGERLGKVASWANPTALGGIPSMLGSLR